MSSDEIVAHALQLVDNGHDYCRRRTFRGPNMPFGYCVVTRVVSSARQQECYYCDCKVTIPLLVNKTDAGSPMRIDSTTRDSLEFTAAFDYLPCCRLNGNALLSHNL